MMRYRTNETLSRIVETVSVVVRAEICQLSCQLRRSIVVARMTSVLQRESEPIPKVARYLSRVLTAQDPALDIQMVGPPFVSRCNSR